MNLIEILMEIQVEQKPWCLHNFGDRPAFQPLLGMTEEWGEFFESAEPEDKRDAIADFMIFSLDFLTAMGWSAHDIGMLSLDTHHGSQEDLATRVIMMLGKLNHAFLKSRQGIRVGEDHDLAMKKAIATLWVLAADVPYVRHSKGLAKITREVWTKVSKRDWKKSPKEG